MLKLLYQEEKIGNLKGQGFLYIRTGLSF